MWYNSELVTQKRWSRSIQINVDSWNLDYIYTLNHRSWSTSVSVLSIAFANGNANAQCDFYCILMCATIHSLPWVTTVTGAYMCTYALIIVFKFYSKHIYLQHWKKKNFTNPDWSGFQESTLIRIDLRSGPSHWTTSLFNSIHPFTELELILCRLWDGIVISNPFVSKMELSLTTPCLNVALNSGVYAGTVWVNIENGELGKSLINAPECSNTFGPNCRFPLSSPDVLHAA